MSVGALYDVGCITDSRAFVEIHKSIATAPEGVWGTPVGSRSKAPVGDLGDEVSTSVKI